MGYVTIAALLCVPMFLERKQSGERDWTSNRALITVLWLGPFAFLGVMASLETFDSLRPFGLFVVITGMRGLQLYFENAGRRLHRKESPLRRDLLRGISPGRFLRAVSRGRRPDRGAE
jgi:hypothetical protein